MRAMSRPLGAALALMVLALPAGSAAAEDALDPGSIAEGRVVATETCGWCHVVATDQPYGPSLKQSTPSFAAIADSPKASRAYLLQFIRTTHWDQKSTPIHMPDTYLTDSQADAVVSYILSLRTKR